MKPSPAHTPRNMTAAWRTAKLWLTFAVLLPGVARANDAGPEAPLYPRDLDAIKAKLEADAAARAARFEEQLRKLQQALADERAARTRAEAERRAEAEATRGALEEQRVVRAGRLGVSLGGFLQADGVAWRQS